MPSIFPHLRVSHHLHIHLNMSYTAQVDGFVSRLEASSEFQDQHSVLSEICDVLEAYSPVQEYSYFLEKLMPIFLSLLESVPISFDGNSNDHKLRNITFEILFRLNTNEIFQPHAEKVLAVLSGLFHEENEDNGVLIIKIITSLHKSYRQLLEPGALEFVNSIIIPIYGNMAEFVEETFNGDQQESHELFRADKSFKTLAECPITMVSIYSSYKQLVSVSLASFIPIVMDFLSLEAGPQARAHREAEEKGEILCSVSPNIKNRALFSDFVLSQVKAVSFLAYIFIRRYANESLEPYAQALPKLVIRLLQDCPSELSSARRELLHAMRHILSTEFRKLFVPYINFMFIDKVIIGEGLTCKEALRPLAYSTIADFVHNVRTELSVEQIYQTVEIYCQTLKDETLVPTVQIMSAKLLLNLVDVIAKMDNKQQARQLFMLVIDAYCERFRMLNSQYHHIMREHKKFEKCNTAVVVVGAHNSRLPEDGPEGESQESAGEKNAEENGRKDVKEGEEVKEEENAPETDFYSLQNGLPIHSAPRPNTDPLKDARYLFRTLMTFLKSIMSGLKQCNPTAPANSTSWNNVARVFSYEEVWIFRNLYRSGIDGLRFFQSAKPAAPIKQTFDVSGPNLPITSSKEQKDLIEIFCSMFVNIDPATFNEVAQLEMDYLYENMLEDAALLHVPQFFLAGELTSSNFCGLLLSFLKTKLPTLGEVDYIKSNILMRLFKFCFMCVNLFPTANESVLLPHLNDLILDSLKLITTTKEPLAYLYLIRTLFRSIGGGRFENLYKEIMPLLQVLLESLNRLIQDARRPHERDIYVELCLTVPVRLSVLVPHLNCLMRPLVYALNGSSDLVTQGLRTLELCVDNLTAEYFDPILEPVVEEVMEALWKHLKPLPYYHQHSHTTFRILGKLGGRNRRFFRPCHDLQATQRLVGSFSIHGLKDPVDLDMMPGIEAALLLIADSRVKSHYRVSAFNYLESVMRIVVAKDGVPEPTEKILDAIFFATSMEEVSSGAYEILEQVCEEEKLASVVLNCVLNSLSHYISAVRKSGISAMKLLSKESTSALREMLLHACYKPSYHDKLGGIIGLETLVPECPIEDLSPMQLELISAIFFVLKDTPLEVPSAVCRKAKKLALEILTRCNSELSQQQVFERPFQNVVGALVGDLSNPHLPARETAQECLKTISAVTSVPESTLISPCKGILLAPIFGKPLRALPFPMQTGNIDAITYCLGLEDTFLEFNEELNRLLLEVVALLGSEDEALTSAHKVSEYRTSEHLITFRVACIHLLTLALGRNEFASSQQGNTRIRVLAVFFSTLCSKSRRVMDAAHQGLKAVLSQNVKLPKELLQNGLRPMLMNLSDHKKLTVSGLEALSRLLELLISYFKVEIGRKLLDHLMAWAQPQTLAQIAPLELESSHTVKIIVAILNIFHLLPAKAYTFLDELMRTLVYLEDRLQRRHGSPFREPLAKFFNRFPEEAVTHFITTPPSIPLAYFVGLPECDNLRRVVKERMRQFQPLGFPAIVDIAHAISTVEPDWLDRDILNELWGVARSLKQDEKSHFFSNKRGLKVLEAMRINFAKTQAVAEQVSLVLEMSQDVVSTGGQKQVALFFYDAVVTASVERKQEVLKLLIEDDKFQSCNTEFLFKFLVNPSMLYEALKGQVDLLMSADLVECIHSRLWETQSLELLQTTSILLKYGPQTIVDLRKEVIKFAWALIKSEDGVTKQSAYVTIAYFIQQYETPATIVEQVFVALLRSHQNESRYLVRQALDLMAGVLTERMGGLGWIKWVRRVLSESGFNVQHVLHVHQFIAHHSDLFYPVRDHFVPNMIAAMGKITVMPNPGESQTLAVELAEGILKWSSSPPLFSSTEERKDEAVEHVPGEHVPGEVEDSQSMDNHTNKRVKLEKHIKESSENDYEIPLPQKEACITYLIRYVCMSPQKTNESDLCRRALAVLYGLLGPGGWSDIVPARLSFFERFLVPNEYLGYCLNALEVLGVSLEWKSSAWILENLSHLQRLLEKCIKSDNHDVQESLQRVLRILLWAISQQEEESSSFISLVVSTIGEHLGNMPSVAAGVTLCWTLSHYKPAELNSLISPVMRTFSKLCRDHIAIGTDSSNEMETRLTSQLLVKILTLCAKRIGTLGDQRRVFLALLAQLIDKSTDTVLLKRILSTVREWVFGNSSFPTAKEKAGLLVKMLSLESRGDFQLVKDYYRIIVDVFKDPQFSHTELTMRLEQPFLVGTRLSDVEIRQELMDLLDGSIERDIGSRLNYVLREQNWEYLAEYPWLNQALQLLYGSFDKKWKVCGSTVQAQEILSPLVDLSYQSAETIHKAWLALFPTAVKGMSSESSHQLTRTLVSLLSRDHIRQQDGRPNVVKSLLGGASECQIDLPPHLVKYLGLSYDGWYESLELLEQMNQSNVKVADTVQDALLEMYVQLGEEDMFYGTWRRRSKYLETNAALSYEQIGMWDKAQKLYEAAQVKARAGAVPFSESEYALWEDHWVFCSEKLQQWDILTELAKHEGFTDLLLECGWRVADWTADRDPLERSLQAVLEVPTPRRQVFETFLHLQGFSQQKDSLETVSKLVDEGIQLSLRKWFSLPRRPSPAHVNLLHAFQQYVELMEASQVYSSLATTTAQNLEGKSQELKRVLQAWRERLPNVWDDINIWGDLVTWRQHAFHVINNKYTPFINGASSTSSNNSSSSSHAYRGYHETAWVINRFAHVARKHGMPEVCVSQLTRIYQLPNIEIQEAFLKLREQAKCHYDSPQELSTGLDVISNTNLVYFATQQKAEFFTLKGMFLAKLDAHDEANQAFATAVQIDLNLPKAWAEWGVFNDKRFQQLGTISYANNAISCYLQAAGLYKNGKTRKLLGRILFLLSLDDAEGTLSRAFESYRGEMPVWYWITFIPQLLTSLSHREAHLARTVLIRIAKSFPQALHLQLRTTREDLNVLQKQPSSSQSSRKPWEYADEIMGILKTAYPLLALSVESLVDQIAQRFKCSPEEDAYRLVVALYNDGVQYLNRLGNPRADARLPAATEANIVRFADTVLPSDIRTEFEKDVIASKPNLETYISKLRKWRDNLETKLDKRFSTRLALEKVSPHLAQFHHQKFEEVEVPGQYLTAGDANSHSHFVKIARFSPELQPIRGASACYKRLTVIGSDGSAIPFAVQFPAARHCRREERVFQLLRMLNSAFDRKVESRRRCISFNVPVAVPLSPHIRIVKEDTSSQSLLSLYESFCKESKTNGDEPLAYTVQKLRAAYDARLPQPDYIAIKAEILAAIESTLVPSTVLKSHFANHFASYEDFWLFRKNFSAQYASFLFGSYVLCISGRQPAKIHISKGSGAVTTSEMLPVKVPAGKTHTNPFESSSLDISAQRAAPIFHNTDPVPFRLTPNIQKLIGEANLEGILSPYMMVMAQSLLDSTFDLQLHLSLFVRDEVMSWFAQQHRPLGNDTQLAEIVKVNVELVAGRVGHLAPATSPQSVATANVLNLISQAVNPRNLAGTDTLWMAYL